MASSQTSLIVPYSFVTPHIPSILYISPLHYHPALFSFSLPFLSFPLLPVLIPPFTFHLPFQSSLINPLISPILSPHLSFSQCADPYAAVTGGTSGTLECSVDTDGDGTPDIEVQVLGLVPSSVESNAL